MSNNLSFNPDWASAPGDTIADILRARNTTIEDFAKKIGITPQEVSNLINGTYTISISFAKDLARELGASSEFWLARDYQYKEAIKRIEKENKEWLHELPLKDMMRFGWLPSASTVAEQVKYCLRFFQVPNIKVWREDYFEVQQITAFRTSPKYDSRTAAVATWLRQGEILAESIQCSSWSATKFKEALPAIRKLTWIKDPEKFLPKLQSLCAESGVAVVIVRSPSGCRASGATRFISETKALLLLSFRYLSDDQFWFTFFHEAGHLILHQPNEIFIEGEDTTITTKEEEANEFASKCIIPEDFFKEFLRLRSYNNVLRFATKIGIAPGIVLGQLQHFGKVDPSYMNKLKRRYNWGDSAGETNPGKA